MCKQANGSNDCDSVDNSPDSASRLAEIAQRPALSKLSTVSSIHRVKRQQQTDSISVFPVMMATGLVGRRTLDILARPAAYSRIPCAGTIASYRKVRYASSFSDVERKVKDVVSVETQMKSKEVSLRLIREERCYLTERSSRTALGL